MINLPLSLRSKFMGRLAENWPFNFSDVGYYNSVTWAIAKRMSVWSRTPIWANNAKIWWRSSRYVL